MTLILIYFLSALSLSFLCSILEAVLLSTTISYITFLEKQGNKTATMLRKFKTNIDRPVGAILSLNTIAHTLGSAGVGAETVKLLGEEYFGIVSAVLTMLILIFSEIIPKTIGASYWRKLALPSARIIHVMIIASYPLVLLSEFITKVFTPKHPQPSVGREEVSAMVDVGTNEGIFKEKESKIIKSCIHLSSVKAKEIMTPAIVCETVRENASIRDLLDKHELNFSRIPVFNQSNEIVIGYVLKDTILKGLLDKESETSLSPFIRPVLTFPEDVSAYEIWEKMLQKREHISVITDDYSGFRGIVTMEDIIEAMTGLEIVDEEDKVVDMQILAREKSSRLFREKVKPSS